jgi:CRISPR-associated protein Cmr4
MYECKSALFAYCLTPLHAGAGTALGVIDNPIQRERHTGHPVVAGSGVKGALRHEVESRTGGMERSLVGRIFGPETNAAEHAGAVAFSDAQLVLFPVRSLRGCFVHATSPTALARLQRLLVIAGVAEAARWTIPAVQKMECGVLDDDLRTGDDLVLESFALRVDPAAKKHLEAIAGDIAQLALPPEAGQPWTPYFRDRLRRGVVLLHDEQLGHFVRTSTVVEPHVRIADESGTADDGGLFYTECLPPESLLACLVMSSRERRKKGEKGDDELLASDVMKKVRDALDGRDVQVGGDATSGRGQVVLSFAPRVGPASAGGRS